MTQEYTKNEQLVFGDVDLSAGPGKKWPQNDIRASPTGLDMLIGKQQTGGWPAHRYFNRQTGLDGKPYPRKDPNEQMCHGAPHAAAPTALRSLLCPLTLILSLPLSPSLSLRLSLSPSLPIAPHL